MAAASRHDEAGENIRSSPPLLDVRGLVKHFALKHAYSVRAASTIRAVDGVSLALSQGEAFGLVGESGCGKSTAARAMLRLVEPDAGSIMFEGKDLGRMGGGELMAVRKRLQIVFQDPYASLNPRQAIGRTLMEPMEVHHIARGREACRRAIDLLDEVGLSASALTRYPHEFSGGQRQRIGIARALALGPSLVVADEPVSALDVSVQAQILLLLKTLQERRGLAFLFVSHDLGVIRWFCARVAVMYLGRIVEQGPVKRVFSAPRHPYSRMLRDASPIPDPARREGPPRIAGEIPSAASPPSGCHFHPRCPRATKICESDYPPWQGTPSLGFACHHPIGD